MGRAFKLGPSRERHRDAFQIIGQTAIALSDPCPPLDIEVERLVQIPGQPPSLLRPPSGCRFHPRCPYVMDKCKQIDPPLVPISDDPEHLQACHLDEETKDREAKKLLESTMAQAS